ncbi:MAG: branched-chain amino acid ABC transporter permease [Synergistaceae bacterium]|jgi:branched-chain amino acid transport system permease protein|nr:branched-chain amino acid ABC transporter permease [Synergistaceae bacterium]
MKERNANAGIRRYAPMIGVAAAVVVFYLAIEYLRQARVLTPYYVQILMFGLLNCMVTLGLNLINGITGQFSIGQAGFVAVGAYSSAAVTTLLFEFNKLPTALQPLVFLFAVCVGGFVAGIFGYLIGRPSLRVKGDYLAIVTLGFGEIIRSLIRYIEVVGGPRGLPGIPQYVGVRGGGLAWVLFFFTLTVWFLRNYIYSFRGRACVSCREDELAAETMGVNTTTYKVQAFIVGAVTAGAAGALQAHIIGFIHPDQFSYVRSTDFLVYLYAGGAGTMSGAIIGAMSLTIVLEVLRFLADWRLVIYGVVLVLMMLYQPNGICNGKEFPFLVPKLKATATSSKAEGVGQ